MAAQSQPVEDTLRGLLGLSLEDDIEETNTNNARDFGDFDEDSNNPAMHAVQAVAKMLKMAERNNNFIDDFFRHEHYLYSCDGNGAYYIISSFTMAHTAPGMPVLSAVTTAVIRCRDSIFIPSQAQNTDRFFRQFLIDRRSGGGIDFRRAPYKLCSKLIMECLQRMKRSNKILQGEQSRTVARLFGLQSRDTFHRVLPTLPEPSPAPNIASLWITLCRPEYYCFTANEDLHNVFKIDGASQRVDETTFETALEYLARDEYRRNRMYAMLMHMALWHTLGGEHNVASWLLWERAALKNYSDTDSAIETMKSNIVVQLVVNKFFESGTGPTWHPAFNQLGEYGRGLGNYFIFQQDLHERGTLPPNFIYTASIADRTAGAATEGASVDTEEHNDHIGGFRKLTKQVTMKKGSCMICGTTTAKETGGQLLECSRCQSVAYCCKDHQVLHWKKGGHKQECMPK